MAKGLKHKLQSLDPSVYYFFKRIREDAVDLMIDGEGYAGTYSLNYARKICKELYKTWRRVYRD